MRSPSSANQRGGIFWGWWIVIGAVVGQFVSMGVGGSIAGVFLRPMTEELDWASAEYTLGASTALAVGALSGFVVGPLVDRFGARPLMLTGACIYAASYLAMSQVDALWQFLLLSMLAGGVGFALVGSMVVNVTLAKWFVVRRGWAVALGSSGISLAALIMPVALTQLVDSIGWRDAYIFLAIFVFAIVVPAALVMRRRPEDHGLLPDGTLPGAQRNDARSRRAVQQQNRDAANSYRPREAMRTPAMWLLIVGYGLHIFAILAVLVHAIPFMTDNGLTRTEAALVVALNGGANLVSKFVWGYLLQRVPVRFLCASALGACASGVTLMLVAAQLGSLSLMFVAFAVWGFGFGSTIPLSEFIWAKYFGRVHIGAVRGASMPFMVVFQATGPFIGGLYFDLYGSYSGIFVAFVGAHIIGAIAILTSREPPPKTALVANPQ